MRYASLFFMFVALAAMAAYSPAAYADKMEDLEVTMEVVDDASELEEAISRMRGPDDDTVKDRYWDYEDVDSDVEGGMPGSAEAFDNSETDFEMDDEFEEDREFEEDAVDDEDDFEDGEDVDDDFEDGEDVDDDFEDDDAGDDDSDDDEGP